MKLLRSLAVCFLLAGAAVAQPVIDADGVVNNASYLSSALPNSGIAQGSIFAVFGRGLGPAALRAATTFPLPTELGGTAIRVTVGATTVNAILLYTSAGQVGAILPSNTPVGEGTMVALFNNQSSATARIRVVRSAFGIFTINQAGSGPAVLTDVNFRVNLITDVFAPNDVAILWGTGLGPVSGNEAGGPLPGDLSVEVEVLVGGRRAELLGKSRSGCCAGLDQIAFRIPAGVEGCYVPVVIRAGGVSGGVFSNHGTIAIASRGRYCSDPHGFSAADLERAASGGAYSTGSVVLSRNSNKFSAPPPIGDIVTRSDNGSGGFFRYDLARLIRSQGAGFAPLGNCLVTTYRGQGAVDPIRPDILDAGPVLNLNGPRGAKQLMRQTGGFYSAQLGGGGVPGLPGGMPDYLDPGPYTVDNGSGGADVGTFRSTLTLPPLLVWTNQDSITNINRGQGLLITWSGGDPNREYVLIIGSSTVLSPVVGVTFICTERVAAGRFTVPVEVLSVLPPSAVQQGIPTGFLSVGSAPVFGDLNRFTARGLDAGYFTYSVSSSKNVNYQ